MSKIILDLCGGTGSWSQPYKDAGYEVIIITLPWYDVTKVEFTGEHFILKPMQWVGNWQEAVLIVPIKQIHGILAAPPCTEFSKAKGNAYRDFKEGMEVVSICMGIIWNCRINGPLKFWALENPVGFLRQFLGNPKFTFEPYEFGSLHSKRTDVWGYFNAPRKKFKSLPPLIKASEGDKSHARSYSNPKAPSMYKHLKLNRAAIRAITPPEFALAFWRANP